MWRVFWVGSRTPKVLTTIGVVALGATAVAVALWYFGRSWDEGMCGNRVLSEHLSPNGQLKVVIFERDCGATTTFSTQASIVDARRGLPPGDGNIYIADYARGSPNPGPGGGPRASARWTSDAAVVVTREAARVFKQEPRHEGIAVIYVEQP
jgi:hypothetical protein